MPALTQRSPKFRLEFVANKSHSVHGGLPAVEALCQQFGLWEKLRQVRGLDCRKCRSQGYSGELVVAQLLCDANRSDAAAIFARHRLKGDKENKIKEVLRGLDLHHPPCAELNANAMFCAIAVLANNVLIALKLLHLPDDCQSWQLKTLLRQILLMPARLAKHAGVLVVRIQVPAAWQPEAAIFSRLSSTFS